MTVREQMTDEFFCDVSRMPATAGVTLDLRLTAQPLRTRRFAPMRYLAIAGAASSFAIFASLPHCFAML